MKEADRITRRDVLSLLEFRSGGGVLSVTIDLPVAERHDSGRLLSEARSGLKALAHEHAGDRHAEAAIAAAQSEITNLPLEARHRSLVYFRALDPDWRFCRSVQLPVETVFSWGPLPRMRSLFSHLNEFPVLGLVVVSQERVRLLTWADGMAREHPELLPEAVLEPRPAAASVGGEERAGSIAGSSGPVPTEDRTRRFLHAAARRIADTGAQEGWQHLLLIGPGSAAVLLNEHLPEPWRKQQIPPIDRNMSRSTVSEIAEAAGRRLAERNREVETAEVGGLINDAQAGGRACLGLQKTLEHLEQRRVDRLLFCSDLRIGGFADPRGRLFEFRVHSPEPVLEEPHLVERMIASALDSGAAVIPLSGDPSRRLALHGGVGARLRWKGANGGPFPEA